MPRLTLIGTIHRDPRGLVRLVQTLKVLNPHVITLEFSTYGLRYRLKKKRSLNHCLLGGLHEIHGIDGLRLGALKELLRTTGIGGIRALLALPFEYKGASFYSQRCDIPLYCVDISSLSRQLLINIDELLEPENLKKVISFETASLRATVTREYTKAEGLLFNGRQSPRRRHMPGDEVWKKRERIMASRIRKIAAHYAGRHIVHIGGWQHLAAQPGTLFSLLEDLTPKRVLLASLYPEPSTRPSLPPQGICSENRFQSFPPPPFFLKGGEGGGLLIFPAEAGFAGDIPVMPPPKVAPWPEVTLWTEVALEPMDYLEKTTAHT